MKTKLIEIATDLDSGFINEKEARTLLLGLLGVGVSLPSANDIQKEAERYQDKSGNQMAIERIAFAQGGLWIRMLWEKSLRQ